ncbi:MAG: efflux transporter outer membrane subunit [Rhodoferax sp.]|uniref:efflux transporter outer membrane subunit n=1 Tax=Rhodoferax sp. TaxID=50421 RepID=UPI0030178AAA
MMILRYTLLPLAAALLLSACAVSPVAPPAALAAPAQFKEVGPWQRASSAASPIVPDAWWTLFKDPVLDDLQQRLVIGNETLKSSVAAVASARAVLTASQSAVFPMLSAGVSGARNGSPTATTSLAAQNPNNSASLSLNASWEVDLWGRLSQASRGATSALQASADDLASARLSAQATLTQTYFSLRTAEAQAQLLERSVTAYQRSLDLTQARYDGGVAPRTDVLQAQTQLSSAQGQLAELTAQRGQLEHAIAVLLGLSPSVLTLAPTALLPDTLQVPARLPATLLERRPDIAAAQARVAASYAQIGVTDAAFFPALTLSGGTGFSNSSLVNLVNTPNLFWSLGSALAVSILDGGQRKQASAQARASADQVTASYRQVVLTALQEVEDNLVLGYQLQQELNWQAQALQSAQRNLEITLDQYRAGTVSYLNVVVAQTAALGVESNLFGVRNRQLAAVNQLLKNIAGRWEPIELTKPEQASVAQ